LDAFYEGFAWLGPSSVKRRKTKPNRLAWRVVAAPGGLLVGTVDVMLRGGGALMVQGRQALQKFRIGLRNRLFIGCKHRRVQLPMRSRQPTSASVKRPSNHRPQMLFDSGGMTA
jgi:hypothetical protein